MNITSRGTALVPSAESSNQIKKYANFAGVHPYYITTLEVKGDTSLKLPAGKTVFAISGTLDETFSVRLGAQWDSPYNRSISSALGQSSNRALSGAAAVAEMFKSISGIETRMRAASAQVWMQTDALTFSLPFTFVAENDAAVDVRDRVMNLLKLVAPSQIAGGAALRAPGPTIGDQVASAMGGNFKGRRITLYMGNFMLLDNCVVRSVDVQFDSRLDKNGVPISCKVQVDVESFFSCFTVQDIDLLFKQLPTY